ncbi:MAG TPA: SDR family NAD(P)-dependent oxidoreductase [Candidatus Alistipes merdigallinarum]|nr:SDR family NAD(P)-dependent oxidoreductase [Candidatus Alistipes merdigallinarum]
MRAAIVIGATSGIGRAVAVQLAAAGYRVGIAGRREELLQELARTMPDRYETEVLDVEDAGACERLEKLAERLGSPELILFCAGTGELNDALDYRLEEATNWVNVSGFTRVMDWAYRYFEQRGGGCLAAITSVMGLRGSRTAPSYAASKAYQINYLEGLRQKAFHQKLPIRIVDLRPGSVRTAMMKGEGHFWIASAEQAARCICKAIEARRTVQYVTPRWRIVGLLLRWMPKWLYQRM